MVDTKTDFISDYSVGRFTGSDKKALSFVYDILYHEVTGVDLEVSSEIIGDLFANGYCYHFAIILAVALGYGEIRWLRGYSHIMWYYNGFAYEIYGIYDDVAPDGMVPLSELGGTISAFERIPPSRDIEEFLNKMKHRSHLGDEELYVKVVEDLFMTKLDYHLACLLMVLLGRGGVETINDSYAFRDVDGKVWTIKGEYNG